MPSTEFYFNAIDGARIARARELSSLRIGPLGPSENDPFSIHAKATILLCYANWEGFYNDAVELYLDFLKERSLLVKDVGWLLLTGALNADFESLRARNHSLESKRDFVLKLRERLECDFSGFDRTIVLSRSNLNFQRISDNFRILNLDASRLQQSRIRLDKELVGWRHAIAHGTPPDLSSMNIDNHLNFTTTLMLQLSDVIQEAIARHE